MMQIKTEYIAFINEDSGTPCKVADRAASFGNHVAQRRKIRVRQYKFCGGSCSIAAAENGSGAVSPAHCEKIIYAIPYHCDLVPARLQRSYNITLGLRRSSAEYRTGVGGIL